MTEEDFRKIHTVLLKTLRHAYMLSILIFLNSKFVIKIHNYPSNFNMEVHRNQSKIT